MFQISNFDHYKALYMLIETYIRERDAQNPYDLYYLVGEDEVNLDDQQEAREGATQGRPRMVSYYVDGAPPEVPDTRVVSIESFYDDGVEEAGNVGAGSRTSKGKGAIESYYVQERK